MQVPVWIPILSAALWATAPQGHADPAESKTAALRILKTQCGSCHNRDKAKGGLSMATREDLLKGGESGAALSLDAAAPSRLLQVLPADVEGHMPPRKQLDEAQMQLLQSWVQSGAPWDDTIIAAGPGPLRPVQPHDLPPGYRPVLALAVSPDDSRLAVGCGPDLLMFSLTDAGLSLTARVRAHPEAVESLAWLPSGEALLSGGFRRIQRWDAVPLQKKWELQEGLSDRITVLLSLPHSTAVFAADGRNGEEGEVREIEPGQGRVLRSWKAHTDTIYAMEAKPDGHLLATAGADHVVRIWNPSDGREVGRIEAHQSPILGLGWNPDGSQIATAGADRQLRFWNADTRANLLTITSKGTAFNRMRWNQDGSAVFTVSADGSATRYHELKNHSGAESSGDFRQQDLGKAKSSLYSLAATSKGDRVFAGSRNGELLVWDANGKLLQQLDPSQMALAPAPAPDAAAPPSPTAPVP